MGETTATQRISDTRDRVNEGSCDQDRKCDRGANRGGGEGEPPGGKRAELSYRDSPSNRVEKAPGGEDNEPRKRGGS